MESRLEMVERITKALEEEFGDEGYNVAVYSLYLGDRIDARIFMELEPGAKAGVPIETRYKDRCLRAGLKEEWLHGRIKLDGDTYYVAGWTEKATNYPIVLKGNDRLGSPSIVHLSVHQLRKLGWEGMIDPAPFSEEE